MEKIRFGIVGTNTISDKVMAGGRQDARFVPTAVCSRMQSTADVFAAKHSLTHTFTSLEQMADSSLIDAVYIASPNFLHAEQSILCMERGKHVLCEKPLAANAKQVKAMIAIAQKYNVTLMEAMKPTLTPNFAALTRHLHRVGQIRHYFSAYCQYSSRYDQYKQGSLPNAFNPAYANGAAMDIGIYTLYPMVILFGKPATINAAGILLPSGVDAQGTVNCRYDQMTATVIYSKIANSHLPTEIQGEEGTLSLDRINLISRLTFCPRLSPVADRQPMAEDLSAQTIHDEYYYEVAEFIDLVLAGRRESSVNTLGRSLATLEIIDEIRRQLGVVYPSDV